MAEIANFTLKYSGALADDSRLDFYDVSQALIGFQRSLALTTHLVLTGEIITQAPSLDKAQIFLDTPEPGSWKITAIIVTSIYSIATAPPGTPLGHMVSSAYDYIVNQSLGFHVDYDSTLGRQIEELSTTEKGTSASPEAKLDALSEKCEAAIKSMHRPMTVSETAEEAEIIAEVSGRAQKVGPSLDRSTYEFLAYSVESDTPQEYLGRISSYNVNTYKGRIYVTAQGRPIPFELSEADRGSRNVRAIVRSLSENAQDRSSEPNVALRAFAYTSRTEKLKRLLVVNVRSLD
jgi:hypothetical protein